MVQANPPDFYCDDDDWGNEDLDEDDWGAWEEAEVDCEFEQPTLERKASSFDGVYSTKQRLDIKFVDKQAITRILEHRIE